MITKAELNPGKYKLTDEQEKNQEKLLKSINIVRTAWKKAMIVTSGVRSQADQTRINPGSPKSKHLIGAAVDVKDNGDLYKWLQGDGAKYLEEADLYCELGTKGWVHFQCLPFGSYKKGKTRWFKP